MLKISVVMPVYNAERYLKEAIDSILRQSFTDFEFIIINDGSTDHSEEIVKKYNDSRIVYLKNGENKGLVYTLNRGCELAEGEYIARMDSDDIAISDRLAKQVAFLDQNPSVGICAMGIEYIGEMTGRRFFSEQSEEICADLLFQCAVCHPTVMLRKSMLLRHGLSYDSNYEKAEDYRLWCQAITKTKICTLKDVGLKYRVHENQVTQKFNMIQLNASNQVREQYLMDLEIPVSEKEMTDFNMVCNNEVCDDEQLDNFVRVGKRICKKFAHDARMDVVYLKITLYQIVLKHSVGTQMSKIRENCFKIRLFVNMIRRKIMQRR